jgi:hypothetical protein
MAIKALYGLLHVSIINNNKIIIITSFTSTLAWITEKQLQAF